uniref:PX domain-containing protein n=1 Tax=Globisporangium ultimum (strain ATCC 200006 / CBS 805.95 / DAOM BR144) TaxID=431595 RepID=K3WE50_GLOUD
MSASAQTSSVLERITAVAVDRAVKRNGHQYFVLSVHLHHTHQKTPVERITPEEFFFRTRGRESCGGRRSTATARDSMLSQPFEEPDYEVEHRFGEFVELRHAIRNCVLVSHSNSGLPNDHEMCSFCGPMLQYINHDMKQPRQGVQFVSTTKVCLELLTTFMQKILDMVAAPAATTENRPCVAMLQTTLLLEVFLRKPRDSSLGII